jgi:Arc/MetJ-type ribon-helix-helix transcriptional regulator
MSKHRRGGYHGGSTIIRTSVGLLRQRTKKRNAKVQHERERFAAEQAAFELNQTATLIKAETPAGRKRLLKHQIDQERAKRRAERKEQGRLKAEQPSPSRSNQ